MSRRERRRMAICRSKRIWRRSNLNECGKPTMHLLLLVKRQKVYIHTAKAPMQNKPALTHLLEEEQNNDVEKRKKERK